MAIKSSGAKLRANVKYKKAHTKQFVLALNITSDADILEKLGRVPNKQGYVKNLIRKDIEKKEAVKQLLFFCRHFDPFWDFFTASVAFTHNHAKCCL